MSQNKHAVALGKKGGYSGRGAAKRRTREQCQAAANKRWSEYRIAKSLARKQSKK